MKTILISIIIFLVGGTAVIVASKNGLSLQGAIGAARSTVRQEPPTYNLVGGGGMSHNAQGKWQASGDECQIYDVEMTDPRTGQKRRVTFSTCPMKCCYTGKEMDKADDWAAKNGVNSEQKKAVGTQLQRGNASASKLPASFGGQAQGGNGSLFVCDPNQAEQDSAFKRLLGRAGFGQDAGGAPGGGTPRSYYSEGGSSETDQANHLAKYTIDRIKEQQAQERMDRVKNDPGAQERLHEAQQAHGARASFEQQMEKKYGKDYSNKMSDQEKNDHQQYKDADKAAQDKRAEDQKKFDDAKKDRNDARNDADKAAQDYKDAGGSDKDLKDVDDSTKGEGTTNCPPDDDRCFSEADRKRLEAGLATINDILAKRGIAPITVGQLDGFKKQNTPIDWKVNPNQDDAGQVPGKRPQEQGACRLPDPTKARPNPEADPTPQCSFDCTVDQMEVGHCENSQQGQQQAAQQGVQAKCGNQRGIIQQGVVDCPQDNPNCAKGVRGGVPKGGGGKPAGNPPQQQF